MAQDESTTHPLTVEIAGELGNIFSVLSRVSHYMRERGYPEELVELMFNEAVSSRSYQTALLKISVITGAQYTLHGRLVHQLGRH
jgi:hypothetical protein